MWFVFVDESGKPKFAPVDVSREPLYVVPAIVIHESKVSSFYHKIEQVKRESLPRNLWEVEIHTKEIVHGNKNYKGVPVERRIRLLNGLFDVIGETDLTIYVAVVDKPKVLALNSGLSRGALGKLAHAYAFKRLADMIRHFLNVTSLKRGPEFLLWVIDDSVKVERERTKENVIEAVLKGSFDPVFGRGLASFYTILPPLFAHSYRHLGLQVADVVAYVVSRKLRGVPPKKGFDFDRYFEVIQSKLGDDIEVVSKIPRRESWWV